MSPAPDHMLHLATTNDVLLVSVAAGQLTTCEAVARFERELRDLIRKHTERHWLMDFGNTTFFITPAVNALLAIMRTLRERGGKLVLTGVTQDVRYVLGLRRLDSILTICPSIPAGMDALGAAPRDDRADSASEAG
jgi:anti-anti-sigma regulatory factor